MEKTIKEQLADEGLCLATNGEAGWYVLVWDSGTAKKVWACPLCPHCSGNWTTHRRGCKKPVS